MAEIQVIKSGLHTSIQDSGRYGYRKYGVPVSGFMDIASARLANMLVNNPAEYPLLEITLQGPKLRFTDTTIISITGANLNPTIDGERVAMNCATRIDADQTLEFGKPEYGVRCYLAVKNGIKSSFILGSYSQYGAITKSSKLEASDTVKYTPYVDQVSAGAKVKQSMTHFQTKEIKVYPGPEYDLLDNFSKETLFSSKWQIGINDRMGYQFTNSGMPKNSLEITTSQVVPGTIQLTPSGKLIALMRDAQVTGGYPRVLQIESANIDVIAQKITGQEIQLIKLIK